MSACHLIILSAVILCGGGLACLPVRRQEIANRMGAIVGILGGLPALLAAAMTLAAGREETFRAEWSVPFGSFYLALDGLSAFFVLAIAAVCILAAVYGAEYMKAHLGRKNLGSPWFFYNVLFASMLLVVTARNGVLFLMAWEFMSLASFFLVMFEHEKSEVREAGWTYLAATHLGTAFLLAMFVLLGWGNQTWDFDKFAAPAGGQAAGVIFLLAVVGFGTKAGFLPMHVWLPEAHPAAPSHVSAVMSGVMIKTGIYGLLRILIMLPGQPPAWWGWTLIGIGAASGVGGVLFALAQHNLKRLLAYHSVENIGIICLGLGLWLVGMSTGSGAIAALGLLGGLLHVWNHAIFKSLLFLGAGSVAHATETLDVEKLGGLLKRMKQTGLTFLIGSAAICGLPPLNGFVSEFLIYLGAFSGIAGTEASHITVAGLTVTAALALIGGLAVACFTKVFGIVFLGEPRSDAASKVHESPKPMLAVMYALAGMCVLIGLLGPMVVRAAAPAAELLLPESANTETATAEYVLRHVSFAAAAVVLLGLIIWFVRRRLLAGRTVDQAGTWDCGYAAPNARMQYTASSFAWPILDMFRWLLRPRMHRSPGAPGLGLFPAEAGFESHTEDFFRRYWYAPVFGAFSRLAGRLRWFQQGRNQLYVLYLALALLILLLWNLG